MIEKLIQHLKDTYSYRNCMGDDSKFEFKVQLSRKEHYQLLSELEALNPDNLIKRIQDLDTKMADDYYIDGYYQAIADAVKIIRGK